MICYMQTEKGKGIRRLCPSCAETLIEKGLIVPFFWFGELCCAEFAKGISLDDCKRAVDHREH